MEAGVLVFTPEVLWTAEGCEDSVIGACDEVTRVEGEGVRVVVEVETGLTGDRC